MYKAVIFDLDGTLLDTLPDLKNSINLALKVNGYDVSYNYEETMWLIGSGTKMLCKRALKPFSPCDEEVEKVFADFFVEFVFPSFSLLNRMASVTS